MTCCAINYKLEKPPKYEYVDTAFGTWTLYEFENGVKYRQYSSHIMVGEKPLVSITSGISPETGKMAVADGFVAIGQRAKGFVAIGQFASGYVSVGQFVTARVLGIGQFCVAPLGIGQFTLAVAAIGQMGIAGTGIFQSAITFFGGLGQSILDLSQYLF